MERVSRGICDKKQRDRVVRYFHKACHVSRFERNTGIFQYTAPQRYAGCGYTQTMVQPDSGGANLSSYLIGLINQGNWRKPTDPGALVAWAWGISRTIDEFALDPDPQGPDA